ncbi:MAG: hypothetical protein CL424_07770 [Acidimicrobiaceae bacterium]|nr:hypothetical protein [Acidimicrobiaceae bacterium]
MTDTQIEHVTPDHTAPPQPVSNDAGAVAISGPAAWDLAQKIARTEFVPQALRGKPESVLAAILYGRELGIGPMQSLQSIHVIDGRPGASPELMRALVARAGHRIDVVESTADHVTLSGERCDTGATATVTWSLEDARQAGLIEIRDGRPWARSKQGRPLPWEQYTRAMLLARATAELCRALFADVISGLSYTVEELQSIDRPATLTAETVDWHGLGWANQAEHDVERDRIRAALADVDGAVRDELLTKWAEMGLAWPLSRDQLAEWEQVAASITDQERAVDADESSSAVDETGDGTGNSARGATTRDESNPAEPVHEEKRRATGPNMVVPPALLAEVRSAAAAAELADLEACEYLSTMFGRAIDDLEALTAAQARAAVEMLHQAAASTPAPEATVS